MPSYYLGIDIGTSGIRLIVINQLQQIIAQTQQLFSDSLKLKIPYDKTIYSDGDPECWWQILKNLFLDLSNKINLHDVLSIAVDGTSATVLAVDKKGSPLHHALMYNDQRAVLQCNKINNLFPSTGKQFSATSGLAKILWLLEHIPKGKIYYFLNQADWITARLSGQFVYSDVNNVLKMGYDIKNKQWPEWFQQLDIPINTLPIVLNPGEFIHAINTDMCQFGFSDQVQIISGTTDSTAAVMASGASQIGETITSLGSTLVTKIISDTDIKDNKTGVYSQPYGNYWLVGGSSNTGGSVLRQYFSQQQINQFSEQIDFFHPTELNYYPLPKTGERFPISDINKKSLLSPRPENDIVFFQAILEGITSIEKQAYMLLNSLGAPKPKNNYTMGGGATNRAWMLYRQNQLQVPVIQADHQDAAYGAAKLALQGYNKINNK
jgi:sugar (pentulose or hexulose) kinase